MRLTESCSLVSLEMTKFGDRITRSDLQGQLNEENNVLDPKAVKVTVDVLGSAEVKELRNIQSRARNEFNDETYAWEKGWRIARNFKLDDLQQMAAKCKMDCETQVELICSKLPEHIAQKERALGALFREEDFPTADQIRDKVNVKFDIRVLPDTDHDPRIGVSESARDRFKQQILSNEAERIRGVQLSQQRDLHRMISHMVERFGSYTGKKEGSFNNTLFTNLEDYVNKMENYNLGNDPEIEKLRLDIKKQLVSVNPDSVRVDDQFRAKKQDEAKALLARVEQMIPA